MSCEGEPHLMFKEDKKLGEKCEWGLSFPWGLSWACQDHDAEQLEMYDCDIEISSSPTPRKVASFT